MTDPLVYSLRTTFEQVVLFGTLFGIVVYWYRWLTKRL